LEKWSMKKAHRAVSGVVRSRARTMRFEATDAERKLWRLLRSHQLAAWKFRRQEPLGPYILDFVCYAASLVIEVDGSQHMESTSDAARDVFG
jgi:very-short-patch-repair endonuclease